MKQLKDNLSLRSAPANLNYRTMSVRLSSEGSPASLDPKTRSFDAIGATEAPVEVYDYRRGEVVPEVLLMSGCEMPSGRQVPLLDSHNRFDTGSVLGSYRNMHTQGDQLQGRVHFSTTPEAESPYTKAREGHLTDFSVGYKVIDSQWVPEGERQTIAGRSFEGPVSVVNRWRVRELSICPIGADEGAKARANLPEKGAKPMDPRLRAFLEKRGLAADATEEQAWAFLQQLESREGSIEIERERVISIQALCRRAGREELATRFIDEGTAIDAVRSQIADMILGRIENGGGFGHHVPEFGQHFNFGTDATDKRVAAQLDGLLLRAGFAIEKPALGADEFTGYSFADHARECLQAAGRKVKGSPDRIISQALESRALTVGDLPTILGNFADKSVLLGFQEAQSPIAAIARTISARDFKDQYLVKLSGAEDLLEIPDKGEYKYSGGFDEFAESYALRTYGRLFAITRKALINDDLGLLGNVGRAQGQAAARLVRDVIVAVLVSNGSMSDGKDLFHADHSNYIASGSGAVPATATLEAAYISMKLQTGPAPAGTATGPVLGILPAYLVVPVALEIGCWQLLQSTGDLTDSKNAGVKNPWYQRLQLVPEPTLDGSDTKQWYLSADPNRSDALVISYLGGQNGPYLETQNGWNVDGVEYKVRMDVAAAAVDWRGLYCNAGQ